ncbi:unnamed protein product, partial [Urochloa humidicola]
APPPLHHIAPPPSLSRARVPSLRRAPSSSPLSLPFPHTKPPPSQATHLCRLLFCSLPMATACRLAAPLGLSPLPRGRVHAGVVVSFAQCGSKVSRGVAVRATSGGEGATEDVPEIVKAAQDAWDKVEDKYAVAAIGVAAIVALWTAVGALKAIDKLPLVPGVLEIVGIGHTGWFTYRNLIFQPDREALITKIKGTYKEITGSSS